MIDAVTDDVAVVFAASAFAFAMFGSLLLLLLSVWMLLLLLGGNLHRTFIFERRI